VLLKLQFQGQQFTDRIHFHDSAIQTVEHMREVGPVGFECREALAVLNNVERGGSASPQFV